MRRNFLHAEVAAVIAAAGASRRLGSPKQLLAWRNTTLLGHAVIEAAAVCGRVIVVTGAEREAVQNAVPPGIAECVHNSAWRSGMGSSLAVGVRRAAAAGAAAVLVMTCDQPLLQRADLAALLALWQNAPTLPAAAHYSGSVGVPAVFPAGWFGRLAALVGDKGARALLRETGDSSSTGMQALEMPAAAFDIDTADDLATVARQMPGPETQA